MFDGDGAAEMADNPHYWVPPTDKQKVTPAMMHMVEHLELQDEIVSIDRSGVDPTSEDEWLAGPHPALGGKSPQQMLNADDQSRDVLARLVAMIEQGSFS